MEATREHHNHTLHLWAGAVADLSVANAHAMAPLHFYLQQYLTGGPTAGGVKE